ncbi:MAG: hypothetical protein ACO3UM_01345 [Planctomycetota bacterium]
MTHSRKPVTRSAVWGFLGLTAVLGAQVQPQIGPRFEAPVLRGLAISPDRLRLVGVHGDVHRIAIYDLAEPTEPRLLGEVEVGLDPVAVAMPNDREVWVVSHGSDSIQIVDVDRLAVVASLPVGDEPSDIVFAAGRAFVSCPTDREVVVLDVARRSVLGTAPVFADEPRALAVVQDRVYVASYRSGNGTTILPADLAPAPGTPSHPPLPPAPQVGKIVRADDPAWAAQLTRTLPDHDVFELDPVSLGVQRRVQGVGTILSGMASLGGALYVTNTEARNEVATEPALRGHPVDHRLTRIDLGPASQVAPFDLNPGVDYATLPNAAARAAALAQPVGVVADEARGELLVAAFGTDRIGIVAPTGQVTGHIELDPAGSQSVDPRQKRGPRSMVIHEAADVLYVSNRLSATVSVVDLPTRTVLRELSLPDDLTPTWFREARGFLYDARLSGNGLTSCASCHVDGAADGLAWDLGDPGGALLRTTLPDGSRVDHHPMKGPMVTLSLQGLSGTEPFHWRGDQPDFASFNVLFATLMGGTPLRPADLADFERFVRTLAYPANPRQRRDGVPTPVPAGRSAADGEQFFHNDKFLFPGPLGCVDCHPAVHGAGGGIFSPGLLRTSQAFESAQLRGLYRRIALSDRSGRTTSGFGLTHDGAFESPIGMAIGFPSHLYDGSDRIQAYLLEFPGDVAPSVGVACVLRSSGDGEARATWRELEGLATSGHCDLVVRGVLDGRRIGLLWDGAAGVYRTDAAAHPAVDSTWIESVLGSGRATLLVTSVPLGTGRALAIDRDGDGRLDGEDRPAGFGAASGACPPQLHANAYPVGGQSDFRLVAGDVQPGSPVVFVLGFRAVDVQVAGLGLLVDPASAVLVQGLADARGLASCALPLPLGWVGGTLLGQAVALRDCGAGSPAASQGIRIDVR